MVADDCIGLKSQYPTVAGLFGGSQMLYFDNQYGVLDGIYHGGCGLVAMADYLLYRSQVEKDLVETLPLSLKGGTHSLQAYQSFLEQLSLTCVAPLRRPFYSLKHRPQNGEYLLGIQGWQLARGFKRYYRRNGLSDRHVQFLKIKHYKEDIVVIIREQLNKNQPVPLLIGPTATQFPRGLRRLGGKQELEMYELTSEGRVGSSVSVASHWVTLVGIEEIEGDSYYSVASWGKNYLIKVKSTLNLADFFSGILKITL
ncbi:hypothetical protein OL233_07385 [Vagococcus sp. PNs007]|uniref:Peptidase C39-like domain-containing protein n=1 Tax=Vagococcus proximus TaxID=2991417 RepID=A0ABT5X290_9ENTE|nr:hypothetical protein [Vagococcus proximus]MDF0480114.1 hypothetical protein [Vagococcus proximus]